MKGSIKAPTTAMVLAAGFGTRLRPITDTIPKPLVPVGGKPILDHIFERLEAYGIERVVVNGHYLSDMIKGHLNNYKGPMEIIFSHEDTILGGVGGVRKVLPELGKGPILLVNGDIVWKDSGEITACEALCQHWQEDMGLSMLLVDRSRALGYDREGDFVLEDNGLLTRREKPMPWVFTGIHLIMPEIIAHAPEDAFSLAEIYFERVAKHSLYGVPFSGDWMEIGTPKALQAVDDWLKSYHI